METFRGQPDLVEFISQDVSTIYYRQVVITRLRKMAGDKSPSLLDIPNPPSRLALTGITANYRDGIARIDYYFQGERDPSIQSDLIMAAEGSLSNEPITSHPKISGLVQNYSSGMRSGKVLWKQYLNSGGANGTDTNGNSASNLNPFSNVDSYLNAGMNYTISKSFSFSSLPDLQIRYVGKIARQAIFGNLPQLPTNYPNGWLYAGFAIQQQGSVYQVTLNYLKSGPGGWFDGIYGSGTVGNSPGPNDFSLSPAPSI